MEFFRLFFDHLAWIEHRFLRSIRDSMKAGNLCGMMRGVGGLRKSIYQSWFAKRLGLGLELLCWRFQEFRKGFSRKRPALFKSGQWHFLQHNSLVHNSILVTDYLTKTIPYPPYSTYLIPCDFLLFPKLRGCPYDTRRWKRLRRRTLARSHNRISMGPCRSCWNGTTSVLQPEEIILKGTSVSCVYYQ